MQRPNSPETVDWKHFSDDTPESDQDTMGGHAQPGAPRGGRAKEGQRKQHNKADSWSQRAKVSSQKDKMYSESYKMWEEYTIKSQNLDVNRQIEQLLMSKYKVFSC